MGRSVIERFWSKTRVDGDCIVWTGALTEGYGVFAEKGTKTKRAHRWLYQRIFGKLPRSTDVMHSCDNRPCVKLQHLSPGSRKMNMQDAAQKNRTHRGERTPSAKLTEAQVRDIRQRHAAGESLVSLAKAYDVHPPCIHKIVTRKHWKHVA